MRRRFWIAVPWLGILFGALFVMTMSACDEATSTANAKTEFFGPKEAEVTEEEDGWKAVHLTASKFMWQFRDDQEPVEVWGYNEQIPGPTLHFREGDKMRVYFTNNLDEPSSVHWHDP